MLWQGALDRYVKQVAQHGTGILVNRWKHRHARSLASGAPSRRHRIGGNGVLCRQLQRPAQGGMVGAPQALGLAALQQLRHAGGVWQAQPTFARPLQGQLHVLEVQTDAKTRCPVRAAFKVSSAVSSSLTSPTRMVSGSWRINERKPEAKFR